MSGAKARERLLLSIWEKLSGDARWALLSHDAGDLEDRRELVAHKLCDADCNLTQRGRDLQALAQRTNLPTGPRLRHEAKVAAFEARLGKVWHGLGHWAQWTLLFGIERGDVVPEHAAELAAAGLVRGLRSTCRSHPPLQTVDLSRLGHEVRAFGKSFFDTLEDP